MCQLDNTYNWEQKVFTSNVEYFQTSMLISLSKQLHIIFSLWRLTFMPCYPQIPLRTSTLCASAGAEAQSQTNCPFRAICERRQRCEAVSADGVKGLASWRRRAPRPPVREQPTASAGSHSASQHGGCNNFPAENFHHCS